MRITRIDFEGRPGHYATAQRRIGGAGASDTLVVAILTPDVPDGREHHVRPDCREDVRSMADCLHHHLEGGSGTSGDVDAYFVELTRLSDL